MKKFLLIAITLFVGKVFAQCPTFTVNTLPKTNPLKAGCYTVNGEMTYKGIQKNAPTAGGVIKVLVEIGAGKEYIFVVNGANVNEIKQLTAGRQLSNITFKTDGKGNNSLQSFKAAVAAAPPKPNIQPPHTDGPVDHQPPHEDENGGGL